VGSTRSLVHGPRTLRGRLTLWIVLSTALSLTIFAAVAYMVVMYEEGREEDTLTAEAQSADVLDEVLTAMAFAAPVGLALAAGGAFWMTRRALRPIDQVIGAAATISADKLDARLPVPRADGELRDLVGSLNGLLERIERGYASLSLFTADASHELRTPLTVIGNELEVALRRPRSVDEWQASARTSLDEVLRLGRLVDALLRMARTEAEPPGRGERVELAVLIEQVVAAHGAAAARAGVSVASAPGETSASITADPDALRSAIANLVSNAIRYTPRGGSVTVALERRDATHVAILVDDTGPGVAADEREAIFVPFARGTQGKRADDASAGLGLGLAIARRIATRLGGTLHAESRPGGGGARFVLALPGTA